MKAVLIDDEYYALQGLKTRLDEIGGIEVVGLFSNGKQALGEIAELKPDIVFLDIEMPNISGIELYRQIKARVEDVYIVFTTAYSQYAVEAFELNALDYMVKPIEKERILKTLQRLRSAKPTAACIETGVTINCFGKMSILIDGKEVRNNLRKKAEELMAFLVCHGGRFVTKERIIDALWPDADREKAANNLYVAFHNLKTPAISVLGTCVESVRGKMRICAEQIKCDVFSFRELCKSLDVIDANTIGDAEKAFELYGGMLFEENFYSWAEIEQAELDVMYLALLDKILEYYRRTGDIAKTRSLETIKRKNGFKP